MNSTIFEHNLDVLKVRYKEIYDAVANYEAKAEHVLVDESVNGETIFAVQAENHLYYLNSRYQDEAYSEICSKQFEEIKYKEVFFVFGLSNFQCAKKITNKVSQNAVLLYEPDKEIFMNALHTIDISDVLNANNVILCVKDLNDKYLEEFLLFMVDYSNIKMIRFCCMLNYERLYGKECQALLDAIKGRCESIVAYRNTAIRFSDEFLENNLANCNDMIEQYSLNQLRDRFWSVDGIEEIPAIVVSAGPSLNKNIDDLKLAEDKAFLIVVDTALRSVLNHGIKPDLVITVDPHKSPMLFSHKDFYDIPLVVCATSNNKIKHLHRGKRIYFYSGEPFMRYQYERFRADNFQCLETDGSVANNAFSLAQVLGFKKIVLVGQDLAYPNKVVHAKEAYMGAEKTIDANDKQYFEVEDIYGNKVYTEASMQIYRAWFEKQIVRYPDLQVIDATEGGAKIKGTEILTLRETIERECKGKVEKDFINQIEKTFKEEETAELRAELDGLDEKLEQIRKDLKNGIRKYEKLEELCRKNKARTKEFRNIMAEIEGIIKIIDNEPVMGFVSSYNKEDEYDVLGQVNDIKNELKDEIKDIVDTGTKMLNSYIKSIQLFEEKRAKRNELDSRRYGAIQDSICQKITAMQELVANNENEKINSIMKVYFVLAIDIIDAQYRIHAEMYQKSVDVLKSIIDTYNDKDYPNMLSIMQSDWMECMKEGCKNI